MSTEIAQAIEHRLEHPDVQQKMGENGRRAVLEKYNWEKESAKLLLVYEELVGKRMNNFPLVSIIIPCRNEEKFIARCLDSIIANDYPKDKLEVLVVDGMSEDGSKAIVEGYARRYGFLKLIENPRKIIPVAMNIGVRHARGDVIMQMSAHSTYPKDYVSKCVQFLIEYEAANVGGIWKITPGADTTIANAIALALSHPFGSGNAYGKLGARELRWADSVACGCYRREIFERIGLFNENLAGSSDMDFNVRLRDAGGKILLVPDIVISYYADPNLRAFWRHNFSDGLWATYVLKFGSKAYSWRHWVPLAFVVTVIGSLVLSAGFPLFRWSFLGVTGAYLLGDLAASLQIAARQRKASYFLLLPLTFASRHIAHGLGALWGLVLVSIPGVRWKGRRSRDV